MNPSADEETLSAAEVSKTNLVTVATVTTTIATVTTTSTTNTQNCGWYWSMLYTFTYWLCSTTGLTKL